MIATAFGYLYMGFISLACGILFAGLCRRLLRYEIRSASAVPVSGVAFLTVYAGIWSLFHAVDITAFIFITLACIIICIVLRHEMILRIKSMLASKSLCLTMILLFAVFVVISAAEPHDWDTYLYHAQNVRWIETYRVVPGLANLHKRFGYNSALMPLHALMSLSFTGHPLHIVNGFTAMVVLGTAFSRIGQMIEESSCRRSLLLWISAVLYFIYSIDSISSLGTDIAPMMILIYIFGIWCDLADAGEQRSEAYGLLALLGVCAVTVKLSVATVALLPVYVLIMLVKDKRFGSSLIFTIMSLVTVTPFFIRNVITSGYLLYPMERIDVFDVDWKVPAEVSYWDRAEIVMFGRLLRGYELEDTIGIPFGTWFQHWASKIDQLPRVLLILCAIFGVLAVIYAVKCIRSKNNTGDVFIMIAAMSGLIYWLLSAPLMRYGFATILIALSVVSGTVIKDMSGSKGLTRMALFLTLIVFILIPVKVNTDYIYEVEGLIWPVPYLQHECSEEIMVDPTGNEHVVYVPTEDVVGGYDLFPETPYYSDRYVRMRGESLQDGFIGLE